jgi:hypothetical protein
MFDKKKLQTLTQNIHEKFVVHNINMQGLQEKFSKAEQDCFGVTGTGRDFSQN